jgi:hypothetical protein
MGKRKVDGNLVDLCEGRGQTAECVQVHNKLKEKNNLFREKAKISKRKLENIYVDSFLGEIRKRYHAFTHSYPGLNEADVEKRKEIWNG